LPPNDPLPANWVENYLYALEKMGDMEMLMERWFKITPWGSRLP
jgi:hypothetical protein